MTLGLELAHPHDMCPRTPFSCSALGADAVLPGLMSSRHIKMFQRRLGEVTCGWMLRRRGISGLAGGKPPPECPDVSCSITRRMPGCLDAFGRSLFLRAALPRVCCREITCQGAGWNPSLSPGVCAAPMLLQPLQLWETLPPSPALPFPNCSTSGERTRRRQQPHIFVFWGFSSSA